MLARAVEALRSRPRRSAALGVVLLLAGGAVVGAVSGGPVTVEHDEATADRQVAGANSGANAEGGSPLAVSAGGGHYDRGAPVAASGPGTLGGAPLPEAVAVASSRVIKTAVLSVGVDKGGVADAYQAAQDAAARAGGWVQSSERATDRATLVVKIPSDRFDAALAALRKLGDVRSDSVSGEDVSAEYVDLEARLKHWRAQEAVFLGLMAKANSISETISIQQQLSVIQEQIEQHEGRRRYLDGQTAYSTVRFSILEIGAAAREPGEGTPRTTLARAWERAVGAALAVVAGTLVVLGVVVPLAVILAVPALIVALARRRIGRTPAPAAAGQG